MTFEQQFHNIISLICEIANTRNEANNSMVFRNRKKKRVGKVRRFTRILYSRRKKIMQDSKIQQCGQIIEGKTCEICGQKSDDQKIMLCDECDDAYHWPCLALSKPPSMSQIWLCPHCTTLRSNIKQVKQRIPENCYKCNLKVDEEPQLKYIFGGRVCELRINESKFVDCNLCKNHYHASCFSKRKNSLNCWDCEVKIRRGGPRSHEQYLNFIREQLDLVRKRGFFELQDQGQPVYAQKQKRTALMNLKLFQEVTNWQLITRYEASLYYALKSRDLIFCDEQIYPSQQMMKLNNSRKEVIQVHALHKQDENTYEVFKAKIRRGAVGPTEIKEDRKVGFYLVAIDTIQRGTIICEYAGEVNSHRVSLTEVTNDSIFTLLLTGRSKDDLNVMSKQFGNVSRFICGVNNKQKEQLRRVNVMSIRFSHHGRMRIIIIAKKKIDKGETLYLDYNAGTYQEYPTADFV